MRTVLFLCTGNYYRSRFAEGLFNHLATQSGLAWRADSRGLALGRTELKNVGPISPYALEAFEKHSVPIPQPIGYPRFAAPQDFRSADHIIALKEEEHRSLVRQHFSDWADRVTYWNIHDVDQSPPHQALEEIATQVRSLLEGLRETS